MADEGMDDGDMADQDYTGGCQCGAVRYRARGSRDRASICYCRMCQRAGGSPFMAFVRFPATQVTWSGTLAVFASSSAVERGFCARCGTPLTYQVVAGPNVSLTIHSLDDPSRVQPELVFSAETQVPWCLALADLTPIAIGDFKFENYQCETN